MDRRTFQIIAAIGALVHGALYLAGVFVTALVTHNPAAGLLAITTAAVTYLSCIAHLSGSPPLAGALTALSIACGAVAGGYLLVT